jgi:hypothetical protein
VRLWPSDGNKGWKQAISERYYGSRPLPVADGEDSLVLFTDIPGSGQQHLTQITAHSVTYWPSLGHGRFGEPVSVEGFSVPANTFSLGRVYLADLDGSGTPDILYLESNGIRIFANESGNRFTGRGVIPLPEGIRGDELCTLQVADVQGLGAASLLLTVPHSQGLKARSWLLNLNTVKPWLLTEAVDNMGGRTWLEYRSSAQSWLDERAQLTAQGKPAVSYLPFPVHTVSRITSINDITGLALGSEVRYLGGVWDSQDREFAGFTRLIQRDTHSRVAGTAAEVSPPTEIRSWFMTGLREHDGVLSDTYRGIQEYSRSPVRFTYWNETNGQEEVVPSPSGVTEGWLRRALRGTQVRTETYGIDGSDKEAIPYSIGCMQWQVRQYDTKVVGKPATIASLAESLSYTCERIPEDPVVSQQLVLTQDKYGTPLCSASVSYPRTLSPQQLVEEDSQRLIYPAHLPAELLTHSLDTQQYDCWINLTRATVHNLDSATDFLIGLPDAVRTDVIWFGTTHPDGNPEGLTSHSIPEEGLSVEALMTGPEVTRLDTLLQDTRLVTMTGYSKTHWRDRQDGEGLRSTPDRQALVAFSETAMHDEKSLDVLRPVFEQTVHALVEEVLNDPARQKDTAVLSSLRSRLPRAPTDDQLYSAVTAYLHQVPKDEQALGAVRAALKAAISVNALRERLLNEPEDALPATLREALARESRVPDAWLPAVAELFTGHHTGTGATSHALGSAHDVARVRQALSAALPDSLFWRCALHEAAGHHLPGTKALLAQRTQQETLLGLLERGGYHPVDVPFAPAVKEVWSGYHNHTLYHPASGFWLPRAVRESELVKATELTYSDHWLAVRQATDGISHDTQVQRFDWRFISPIKVKDINDNVSEARQDALGRAVYSRFYGTETPPGEDEAQEVGYAPFTDISFTPPGTVEEALALNSSKGVPVHEAFTAVIDSWMPLAFDAQGRASGKRCGELQWQRQAQQLARDGLAAPNLMEDRTPPHLIRIQTDRYDADPEQQVRVQVMLNGGGQLLQTAVLNPPGEAFVRTAEGGLLTGDDAKAVTRQVPVRWAVTGKTEFDNKGQAIRTWQPFYLDDWRWVSDDSARDGIYADTQVYDAVGRQCKVIRAAGEDVDGVWANYESRVQAYPWFTVSEDENDTWLEVIERAKRR